MKRKILSLLIMYIFIVFLFFPLNLKADNVQSEGHPVFNFVIGLKRKFLEKMREKGFKQYPSGLERFGGWWDPLDLYNSDPDFRRRSDEEFEKMKKLKDGLSTTPRAQWERQQRELEEFLKLNFPDWFKDPPPPDGSSTMPPGFNWKLFDIDMIVTQEYNSLIFKIYHKFGFYQNDGKDYIEFHSVLYDEPGNPPGWQAPVGWWQGSNVVLKPDPFEDPNMTLYYDFRNSEDGNFYCYLLKYDKRSKNYEKPVAILIEAFKNAKDDIDDHEFENPFLIPDDGKVFQPDWSKLPNVKKYMGPDGRVWYSVDEDTMLRKAKDLPLIQVDDGQGYDIYYDKDQRRFILVPQGADFPPLKDDGFTVQPPPDVINDPGQPSPNPGQPSPNPGQPSPNPGQPQPGQPDNLLPPTDQQKQQSESDAFDAITSIEFNPEIKKRDWTGKFPFSLPFDIAKLVKMMAVKPKPINFKVDFKIVGVRVYHTFDFSMFDKILKLIRFFFMLSFIFTLVRWTRSIAKW